MMPRLKILLLGLACLLTRITAQKLGPQNFTSEWLIFTGDTYPSPMVAKVQGSLIFVSFPANFGIKLEALRIIGKPCELAVAQFKTHRNKNIVPIYAEGMGNGKLLVAVLIEAKFVKEANYTNVWLYAIDPLSCSFDFTNFTLDASLSDARDNLIIVPYKDSFDVFVKSDDYCVPGTICNFRYSNDLTLLRDYEKLIFLYEDEDWDLITKRDFDPSEGYMNSIMNTKLNRTILRFYDSKFSHTREIRLNYDESVAFWYSERRDSAATCVRITDQKLKCALLDAGMEIEYEAKLYYDSFIQYYGVVRLASGEALVLTVLSWDPVGTNPATFVQIINGLGEISPPIKFQEYQCESVFELNTFELREGLYCVSTTCTNVISNKCIGPESELEF